MYKIIQLHQPARRVYDTYDWTTVVIPAFNQLKHMSERQLYYTYCTGCWLETGGGDPKCPRSLYSSWSHLLPCFLLSFSVLFVLFRQGGQQQCRLKADSFNARQLFCLFVFAFCWSTLRCICNKCPPHRLRDGSASLPSGARQGRCHGNLRVLSREEKKLSRKKDESKYQLSSHLDVLSLLFHLTVHFSLPFTLNWTHTF